MATRSILLTTALLLAWGTFSAVEGGQAPPGDTTAAWMGDADRTPFDLDAPDDPGERYYRNARAYLARGAYEQAIELFQQLREEHPESVYVADSYFYEALARLRLELHEGDPHFDRPITFERRAYLAAQDTALASQESSQQRAQAALQLLRRQLEEHADSRTAQEARLLERRLQVELERQAALLERQAALEEERRRQGAAAQCPEQVIRTREAALHSLLRTDPAGVGDLIEELAGDEDPCAARLRRTAVMGAVGNPEAIRLEVLAGLAEHDEDPQVRQAALMALGRHPDPSAREVLWRVAEAGETAPDARSAALHFLASRATDRDLARFRELFVQVESPELRLQIVTMVAQQGREGARDWLLALARDRRTYEEIRRMIVFTGDWSGATGRLVELYGSLDDDDPLRRHVIFGLTRIPDDEATEALIRIVRELPEGELRQEAVFSLGQRDDPRVRELMRELVRGGPGGVG